MLTFEPLFETKPSKDEVTQVEVRMGLKFPNDYRSFLLNQNGGAPTPSKFAIPACKSEAIVGWLYGIGDPASGGDVEHENGEIKGELPSGVVIIGHDPGGNRILLATKGKLRGKVFYWDSARFFDCSSDDQNTYPIAKDFASFLDSLKPVNRKQPKERAVKKKPLRVAKAVSKKQPRSRAKISAPQRIAKEYDRLSLLGRQTIVTRPSAEQVVYFVVGTRCSIDIGGFSSVFEQDLNEAELAILVAGLRSIDESDLAGEFEQGLKWLKKDGFYRHMNWNKVSKPLKTKIEAMGNRIGDRLWDLDEKLVQLLDAASDRSAPGPPRIEREAPLRRNDFRKQRRGSYAFDRWRSKSRIATALGELPIELTIHDQDPSPPDDAMLALAGELASFAEADAARLLDMIHGHYRYAEQKRWLAYWNVPGRLPRDRVLTQVESIELCVRRDRDVSVDCDALVQVNPRWDPEHKLSLRYRQGKIVEINDEAFTIKRGVLYPQAS